MEMYVTSSEKYHLQKLKYYQTQVQKLMQALHLLDFLDYWVDLDL